MSAGVFVDEPQVRQAAVGRGQRRDGRPRICGPGLRW
jgi:hypothetical protein